MSNNKEIFEYNNPNVKFGFVPNIILNIKIMEKKQSSIEWYENKLIQLDIDFGGHKNYWVERKKLRDQAKAMHKEEVMESYRQGRTDQQASRNVYFYHRNAESYFNETFGGQK